MNTISSYYLEAIAPGLKSTGPNEMHRNFEPWLITENILQERDDVLTIYKAPTKAAMVLERRYFM